MPALGSASPFSHSQDLHKGSYKDFNKTYDYIMAQWYPESGEKFRTCRASTST
jgi:hypothetical protein